MEEYSTWPTGRLLSTAARLVEHAWNARLASWDLTHAGLAVLHVLAEGPKGQREVAASLGIREQTASRTIERLERAGYVSRTRHPQDRRRVVVARTPAGTEVFAQAADPEVVEGLVTGPVDDPAALRRALVAIVAARSTQQPPRASDRGSTRGPGLRPGAGK